MKNIKKILTVSCFLALALTPVVSYGDTTGSTVQTSPRMGIPVVGSNASAYANVAISHVSNYVNVRTEPNTTSGIVGKIYNNCAATILASVDGEGGTWYQIQSGNVKGYIKAEYFITGAEAEKIAKQVGTVFVTINTTTLRLREEPNTTSHTLTLLSQDAEYIAIKEEGDFVEIQVDSDLSGYVHKDYVNQRVEFEQAVSVEEEQQKKEEAEKLKREAEEAIAVMEQLKRESDGQSAAEPAAAPEEETENTAPSAPVPAESIGIIAANPNEPLPSETAAALEKETEADETSAGGLPAFSEVGPGGEIGPGMDSASTAKTADAQTSAAQTQAGPGSAELTSATRTAIVAYAKQFLGNPYVYGGTSLTEGADCSGFTMKVFEHFGISTGRTSRDQAANGKEISLSELQPGDLVFYASGDTINHVALYIGGGQIIHASTPQKGITTNTAYYRTPYKAVTFLN